MTTEVVEQPVVADCNPLAGTTYEERLAFCSVIAKPMASEKLTRNLGKLMKKAKRHSLLVSGAKDAAKHIARKKSPGILVIAGDVSPIDSISHLPLLCESNNIPYCYVPSRYDLCCTTFSSLTSTCVFIRPHEDYESRYNKCYTAVDQLPLPIR